MDNLRVKNSRDGPVIGGGGRGGEGEHYCEFLQELGQIPTISIREKYS